jgi:hypothetical protein
MGLSRWRNHNDLTTEYLILYLEACIAVLMACIAAFRSVFVENKRRKREEQVRLNDVAGRGDLPQRPDNFRGRIQRMRAKAKEDADLESTIAENKSYLPRAKLEGPKLKGVLTFMNNLGSRSAPSAQSSSSRTMADSSFNDLESDTWTYTTKASSNNGGFERLKTDTSTHATSSVDR